VLHRFKHYHRNMGNRDVLINLIVVAYLGYVFFGNGIDSVGLILGGSMIVGALMPRLFLGAIVNHPGRMVRFTRIGQISIIVLLIVNYSGLWNAPTIVWVLLCPFIGVLLGTGYWLLSDPRILTQQGFVHYHAYADAYDEPEDEQPETNSNTAGLPPLVR
jgi:hypothetical protein